MIDSSKISQLAAQLQPARSVIIIVNSQPTFDQAAAALALAQSLVAAQKEVVLASSNVEHIRQLQLQGGELFQDQLGNRDLQVSFEYRPEAVDKVSYHINEENQRFYLVIKPQKGQKPLDSQSVQMEYAGAEADVVFLVGVHDLESLEHLYFGYERLYENSCVVTIHTFEPNIGQIKLDISGSSSLSEAMSALLTQLQMLISSQSATNLLRAIEEQTNRLQDLNATADTFATVAELLRAGARRMMSLPSDRSDQNQTQQRAKKAKGKNGAVLVNAKDSKTLRSSEEVGSLNYQPSNFNPRG